MFRRPTTSRWVRAFLILAAACTAQPALGQTRFPADTGELASTQARTPADSLRRALEEEWSMLLPRWKEAAEAAQASREREQVREKEENQMPVDTFHVGPFQIAAVRDQVEMARGLFEDIWSEWGDVLAGSEDLLRPWTFLVHRSWSGERITLPGDSVADVQLSWHHRRSLFQETAHKAISRVLYRDIPQPVRAWASRPTLSDRGFQGQARFLATGASFVVRECYTGDLEGCRKALGLAGVELEWGDFYTPPERRLVVARRVPPSRDGGQRALWNACVRSQDLRVCDQILEGRPPMAPFPKSDRSSLVLVALRLGGTGAFARLGASGSEDETVLEALSRTAGVSADSLLAAWRTQVLESQTSAWAGMARTPFSVLIWFVFFGFLAMRSTRWRLG